MKKIYSLVILTFLSTSLFGQAPTYQWAKQITGSHTNAQMEDIVTDNNGYVYITGSMQGGVGNADFDPSASTFNLSANGPSGCFVAKYDPNGSFVWAFLLDGTGTDEGHGIAVDNTGNVYVTGNFQNTIDFDPGVGVTNLTAPSNQAFVAKYLPNGAFVSAFTMSNTAGQDIAIDGANNVIISGSCGGTVDFDPSAATYYVTGAKGYIAKYSNTFIVVWATGFTSVTGTIYPLKVEFDALNKIYVAGHFTGGIDMDPTATNSVISTIGIRGGFFARYNSDGSLSWARSITGSSTFESHFSYDLSLDKNANVYVCGQLDNYPVDFDPSPATFTLDANGSSGSDGFLAKYDSLGNYFWAMNIGANNVVDAARGVDVDIYDNPVVVGHFRAGTDFDPSASTATLNITTNGSGCCLKYSSTGNFIYGFSYFSSPSAYTYNYCCDVSSTNYLHVFGHFAQTVDFDPSVAIVNLTSASNPSNHNMHIAKYDAGCTSAPSTPSTISGLSSMCNGASATTYSVTSIVGATSYSWTLPGGGWSGTSTTNTINLTPGSGSGNLSVIAINSCGSSSASILSITVNPQPTISVNSGSICLGSSFTMTPSGASTYTIQGGSAVVSPTANASYTVVGTSTAGCVSSVAAISNVTVNTLPTINASTSNTMLCVGQSATLTASGAFTYTFNPGGAAASIVVSPTVTSTYTISGTSTQGCSNSSVFTQSVSTCAGINQTSNSVSEIQIYPNPFHNKITITSSEVTQQVLIFNTVGALIYKGEFENSKTEIDLSKETNGIYFLKVGVITRKIVKQ